MIHIYIYAANRLSDTDRISRLRRPPLKRRAITHFGEKHVRLGAGWVVGKSLLSTNGVVPACQPPGPACQAVRLERLWETRGSRLPLRGVIRLWIAIGSLWNLDRPRQRSPTGRGPRAVSAEVCLIRKKRGYYAQGFDLRFRLRQLDFFQPENFVSVLHKVNTFGELRSIR